MKVVLDPNSIEDYKLFLRLKSLPSYRVVGREVSFPDEYAALLDDSTRKRRREVRCEMPEWMFDYQRDITAMAIRKQKFAVFADCGLGKTAMLLEFARHCWRELHHAYRKVLIVSPLMVIRQTLAEAERFYGKSLPIMPIRAKDLGAWLASSGQPYEPNDGYIGITNYEAIVDGLPSQNLGALILDESSMLKSHYGAWGQRLIRLGRGVDWKLCLTGTPAPNDRIEYANHAVFLDAFPTTNAFLSRYFVNRGKTDKRWELKPHALAPFYKSLSHWCIFLTNPATYGWKDNTESIPPIHIHIDDVPMTDAQRQAVIRSGGNLYGQVGGITSRTRLAQIAKGRCDGEDVETLKPAFIRRMVDAWPDESTIIWCLYNAEQDAIEKAFPYAASIRGETPYEERERMIDDFKAKRTKTLISKPRVLGFGLNLQVATRQVFSGLQDSYEQYYQAVKRSNRYGSTLPLNVHIPVTEVERPMIETVLAKAKRVQEDTEIQECLFKESCTSASLNGGV